MSDIEEFSNSSYESSASSNDEEYLIMLEERVILKNEHYLKHTVPQGNDGDYFKYQSGSNDKINAISQILIFLWFAGHQTSLFRDVEDQFNLSISSVYRNIRGVDIFSQ
ncbi:hypothetical protein NQ314_001612 [Rhamnusium bicolor]|uniref:Transposase Helix-turn-helix domain-containing protein n=1 Tax=Rhamnusium bicolor TaxID=1586634 RepID=A0AAV8ZRV2_9CUCU|nr:hypothetical protein NQ314_001612 [Rhamnusium bicolor]